MKKLRISYVMQDTMRDKILAERISRALRASTSGRSAVVVEMKPDQETEVQFVLTGEPTGKAPVTLDFTGKDVENGIIRQPALLDFAISGVRPPKDAGKKIQELDGDNFTWAIVVPDSKLESWKAKYEGRVLSESEVFEQPERLNKAASHTFIVSEHGGPMVCERLVAYQVTMPFYIDADPKNLDTSAVIPCSSIEDAFVKAEALAGTSGGTVHAFRSQVASKTFSQEAVTARSARSVLGSLLKMKTGSDFGFFDLHIGDSRLLELATGPTEQ